MDLDSGLSSPSPRITFPVDGIVSIITNILKTNLNTLTPVNTVTPSSTVATHTQLEETTLSCVESIRTECISLLTGMQHQLLGDKPGEREKSEEVERKRGAKLIASSDERYQREGRREKREKEGENREEDSEENEESENSDERGDTNEGDNRKARDERDLRDEGEEKEERGERDERDERSDREERDETEARDERAEVVSPVAPHTSTVFIPFNILVQVTISERMGGSLCITSLGYTDVERDNWASSQIHTDHFHATGIVWGFSTSPPDTSHKHQPAQQLKVVNERRLHGDIENESND